MTPYQKASLARAEASDAESLRRYEETLAFNKEKHEESIRQYEDGVARDYDASRLSNLERRARINKIMVDTDARKTRDERCWNTRNTRR